MLKLPFKKNLQETQLAINAAIEAGKIVMKIYGRDFSATLKNDNSPLTDSTDCFSYWLSNSL